MRGALTIPLFLLFSSCGPDAGDKAMGAAGGAQPANASANLENDNPEAPLPGEACVIDAFSQDPDTAGLNVRAGPGERFAIVGKLPPRLRLEHDREFWPAFYVVEARDGWLRIRDASYPVASKERPGDHDWVSSPVRGWISGMKAGSGFQSDVGFERPDAKSRPVLLIDPDKPVEIAGIVDCKGEWARIAYGDPARLSYAWRRDSCNGQETSCDQPGGKDYIRDGKVVSTEDPEVTAAFEKAAPR